MTYTVSTIILYHLYIVCKYFQFQLICLVVVLYDCSRLEIGCSSCLSVGSDFNCGYCNDLSDCVLRGQCGSGTFVVPPNFTLCREPEVDSVSVLYLQMLHVSSSEYIYIYIYIYIYRSF